MRANTAAEPTEDSCGFYALGLSKIGVNGGLPSPVQVGHSVTECYCQCPEREFPALCPPGLAGVWGSSERVRARYRHFNAPASDGIWPRA